MLNIGEERLSAKAEKMEFKSKSGDLAFCVHNIEEFDKEAKIFYKALEELIKTTDQKLEPLCMGQKPQGDLSLLLVAMEEVRTAIDQCDPYFAIEILGPFKGNTFGAMLDEKIVQLAQAMENMDYDQAETLLEEICHKK